MFSGPCFFGFHLNHPSCLLSHVGTTLLTPAAAVENDIDSLSFGNTWLIPWKEKLSSSQGTGENWGWYSNLWILQKSISLFLGLFFFFFLTVLGFCGGPHFPKNGVSSHPHCSEAGSRPPQNSRIMQVAFSEFRVGWMEPENTALRMFQLLWEMV